MSPIRRAAIRADCESRPGSECGRYGTDAPKVGYVTSMRTKRAQRPPVRQDHRCRCERAQLAVMAKSTGAVLTASHYAFLEQTR